MALRQEEDEELFTYFYKWLNIASRIQPNLPEGRLVQMLLLSLNKANKIHFSMYTYSTLDQIRDRTSFFSRDDYLSDDDDDHWERPCNCIFDWV